MKKRAGFKKELAPLLAALLAAMLWASGCVVARETSAEAETPPAQADAEQQQRTAAPTPALTPDPRYRKLVGEAHTAGGTLRVYASYDESVKDGKTVYTAANVWIEAAREGASDAAAPVYALRTDAAPAAETQLLQYCFDLSASPAHFVPLAWLADVNADGSDDLLIYTGCFGAQSERRCACYLYTDAGYAYLPGYEEIANPVPLAAEGLVLSSRRESASCRSYAKYILSAEGPVMTARLTLREENGETRCTEERLTGGALRTVRENAALSELDAAYWNIDDPVWTGQTE